jgi:hypothetical protein
MKTSDKYAAAKVPAQITAMFWVLKLLTTGMGEAMSDFMGDHSVPIAGCRRHLRAVHWRCGCSCASASTGLRTTGSR